GAVAGALGLLHARTLEEEVRILNAPLAQLKESHFSVLADASPAATDTQIVAALAPSAFMHPVELTLPSATPTVADVRAAFDAYHLERHGAVSREPGHVFSVARRTYGEAPAIAAHSDAKPKAPHAPAYWQPHHGGDFFRFERRSD